MKLSNTLTKALCQPLQMKQYLAALVFSAASSGALAAYDCTNLPDFPLEPPSAIRSGDIYQHLGSAYLCEIGGWCGSPSLWAFEPGVGYYWEQAWDLLGVCADFANTAPELTGFRITDPLSGQSIEYPAFAELNVNQQYNVAISVIDAESNLSSWELSRFQKVGAAYVNQVYINRGDILATDQETIYAGFNSGIEANDYALRLTINDNAGGTVEVFFDYTVLGEVKPALSISSTHAIYLGQFGSTDISAWHATLPPARPNVSFTPGSISDLHAGSGSSSGGAAIGYEYRQSYTWRAAAVGPLTISASNGEQSIEAKTEILPQDGLPVIRIQAPEQANQDERVLIAFTALDHDELLNAELVYAGDLLSPHISNSRMIDGRQWGLDQTYELTMPPTDVLLQLSAEDGDGNISTAEVVIALATDAGECEALGIDVDDVNEYPDWPRLDWQGLPSNAVNGDLMLYQGSIYRAKWWTQAIPGSDESWEFQCDI